MNPNNPTNDDTPAPAVVPTGAPASSQPPTIRQEVTSRVASIGPTVREILITQLAADEQKKIETAVSTCFSRLEDIENNLRKIEKPDNTTYNADGTVATATYSKGRLEEIKKSKENRDKYSNALKAAFEESKFEKLIELSKQNPPGGNNGGGDKSKKEDNAG